MPLTEGAAKKALAARLEYFQQVDDGSLGAPYAWAPEVHLDGGRNRIDDQVPPTPNRRMIDDGRCALLDPKRDVIAMNLDRFAGDPSALNSLVRRVVPCSDSLAVRVRDARPRVADVDAVTYYWMSVCRLVLVVHPDSADRLVDLVTVMALAMLHAGRLALDAEWIRRTRVSASTHRRPARDGPPAPARPVDALPAAAVESPARCSKFVTRSWPWASAPSRPPSAGGDAMHADVSLSAESLTDTARILTTDWLHQDGGR